MYFLEIIDERLIDIGNEIGISTVYVYIEKLEFRQVLKQKI